MQKAVVNVAGGLLGYSWFVRHPNSHCPGSLKDLEKNGRFVREEPYETFSLGDIPTLGCQKSGSAIVVITTSNQFFPQFSLPIRLYIPLVLPGIYVLLLRFRGPR